MGEGINVFNSSEEEALTCLDPKKRERRETFLDILCVVKTSHRQCALSIRFDFVFYLLSRAAS